MSTRPDPAIALTPGPRPAQITLRRLVEFPDIDISGHYHNSAVIRWIEAAEAVLHSRLGIAQLTFGFHPRLQLDIRFHDRLYFLDEIDIDLTVIHVGRTSVRYAFDVRRGETIAVSGEFAAAYLPEGATHTQPWPEQVRKALTEGGDRTQG